MVRAIKVQGPVILEFPDGVRVRIEVEGTSDSGSQARPGRPPSKATIQLQQAMERDRQAGRQRDRSHYLGVLRKAGHKASETSARIIVNREAKRTFGKSLGRTNGLRRTNKGGARRGRAPSPETVLLRERIAADKELGKVGEPAHYLTWLMDQPTMKLGIKKARPIVYRELRAAKS